MGASDRIGDKNWETYTEERVLWDCDCGRGKVLEEVLIASHEKVLRQEEEVIRTFVRCTNPDCPSKKKY